MNEALTLRARHPRPAIEERPFGFHIGAWQLIRTGRFWAILLSTALYNTGIAAFLFLYNLLLLDRGFGERSIGLLASAVVLGTMIGTVPIGLLAGRLGTRPVMIGCLLMIGLTFSLKACTGSFVYQLALDLIGGVIVCGWSVCLSPLVASTLPENLRPRAFTMLYATSIVSCGLGGFLGGHLPGWCQYHTAGLSPLRAKQYASLILCAIGSLAVVPLIMLRERGVHIKQRWSLPASRHQFPVLAALGCWNFALGSFNPFVTVFLSKHLGAPIAGLGSLVSVLQVLQALAVLSSPWILRRLALGTGIMTTQLFAAGSLVVLSLSPTWLWASIPLTGYLLAQHMSEPGVQTWLMDSADETQRSGLSAVYLLVVSGCQAVAAAVAGSVTARFGYKPMMVGAACIAVFAAVLFRFSCSSPGAQSYGPAPVEQTTLGAGNSSGAITRP